MRKSILALFIMFFCWCFVSADAKENATSRQKSSARATASKKTYQKASANTSGKIIGKTARLKSSKGRRPTAVRPSSPKALFVIGGFLETSKDKKYYILETGHKRYFLRRKTVFLTNQPELKRLKPRHWINLKVRHSDIIKVEASKMKKQQKAVL